MKNKKWKIWKRINLGTHRTVTDLCKAIEDSGSLVHSSAEVLFAKSRVGYHPREINLVIASLADLGFTENASYSDVIKMAEKSGLKPCPPEVGLQLRLQYSEQPVGEELLIAMDGIQDDTWHHWGRYCVTNDINEGKKVTWHNGEWIEHLWKPTDKFVFSF